MSNVNPIADAIDVSGNETADARPITSRSDNVRNETIFDSTNGRSSRRRSDSSSRNRRSQPSTNTTRNSTNIRNSTDTRDENTTWTRSHIPLRLWEQMFDVHNAQLFSMSFNAASANDVRKNDVLVCPMCMVRHLPVKGSARVPFVDDAENEDAAGDNDVNGDVAGENGGAVDENEGDENEVEDADNDDVVHVANSSENGAAEPPNLEVEERRARDNVVDDNSAESMSRSESNDNSHPRNSTGTYSAEFLGSPEFWNSIGNSDSDDNNSIGNSIGNNSIGNNSIGNSIGNNSGNSIGNHSTNSNNSSHPSMPPLEPLYPHLAMTSVNAYDVVDQLVVSAFESAHAVRSPVRAPLEPLDPHSSSNSSHPSMPPLEPLYPQSVDELVASALESAHAMRRRDDMFNPEFDVVAVGIPCPQAAGAIHADGAVSDNNNSSQDGLDGQVTENQSATERDESLHPPFHVVAIGPPCPQAAGAIHADDAVSDNNNSSQGGLDGQVTENQSATEERDPLVPLHPPFDVVAIGPPCPQAAGAIHADDVVSDNNNSSQGGLDGQVTENQSATERLVATALENAHAARRVPVQAAARERRDAHYAAVNRILREPLSPYNDFNQSFWINEQIPVGISAHDINYVDEYDRPNGMTSNNGDVMGYNQEWLSSGLAAFDSLRRRREGEQERRVVDSDRVHGGREELYNDHANGPNEGDVDQSIDSDVSSDSGSNSDSNGEGESDDVESVTYRVIVDRHGVNGGVESVEGGSNDEEVDSANGGSESYNSEDALNAYRQDNRDEIMENNHDLNANNSGSNGVDRTAGHLEVDSASQESDGSYEPRPWEIFGSVLYGDRVITPLPVVPEGSNDGSNDASPASNENADSVNLNRMRNHDGSDPNDDTLTELAVGVSDECSDVTIDEVLDQTLAHVPHEPAENVEVNQTNAGIASPRNSGVVSNENHAASSSTLPQGAASPIGVQSVELPPLDHIEVQAAGAGVEPGSPARVESVELPPPEEQVETPQMIRPTGMDSFVFPPLEHQAQSLEILRPVTLPLVRQDQARETSISQTIGSASNTNAANIARRPQSPAGVESVELPPLDGNDADGEHSSSSLSSSSSMPSLHTRQVSPTSSDSSSRSAYRIARFGPPMHQSDEELSDASSSSIPPLHTRGDLSSSEDSRRSSPNVYSTDGSMPALVPRYYSSSSSDESVPRLRPRRNSSLSDISDGSREHPTNAQFSEGAQSRDNRSSAPELRLRRSLEERYTEVFETLQATYRRQGAGAGVSRNNNNGLSHLRDYGAIRVFASATCPICLDDHSIVVALKCGHCLCPEDYRKLGGYLASDKDKLLAEAQKKGLK